MKNKPKYRISKIQHQDGSSTYIVEERVLIFGWEAVTHDSELFNISKNDIDVYGICNHSYDTDVVEFSSQQGAERWLGDALKDSQTDNTSVVATFDSKGKQIL